MKHYVIEYLVVALLIMASDAILSTDERMRYEFFKSFLFAILWPITLTAAIIYAMRKTRHLSGRRRL